MPTVLIIDDSPTLRELTRRSLAEAGLFDRFLFAGDGLAGFRQLATDRPDLVICDLEMPGTGGRRFLDMRRSAQKHSRVPVIVLTADGAPESKAELLEAGASDYVVRPFHPRELVARIRVHLELRRAQAELAAVNARLETLARTDPLTGLANRRVLDEQLEVEIARAARHGTALSLALLDVDRFKLVNDTRGHAVGDDVLRAIASVLSVGLRKTDLGARYGGEEIAILLPHAELADGFAVCERIREAVASLVHSAPSGAFGVTISVGVAALDGHRRTATELLLAADEALYQAKREGRDRVIAAPPTDTARATVRPASAETTLFAAIP